MGRDALKGTMVIGVWGKYCAGKNTIVRILKDYGFYNIDMDDLGHLALEEKKEDVIKQFGNRILDEEGNISRPLLGKIVFSNAKALHNLEKILQPLIVGKVRDILRKRNGEKLAINGIILFSAGLHKFCEFVIWVKAPILIRIKRGLMRDNLSVVEVGKRIWVQRKLSPQSYENDVDIYIVENPENHGDLEKEIKSILACKGL